MSDRPTLGLTTGRQAAISVISGAVISGLVIMAFEAVGSFPPVVPWTVAALLALLAVAVAVYSRVLRRRLKEHTVPSQESVTALVLGKTMVMTGAVFAGAYVIYVIRYAQLIAAPVPAQRVVNGAATIVAALLLAGAGTLLERACVVDDGDDDHEQGGSASPA